MLHTHVCGMRIGENQELTGMEHKPASSGKWKPAVFLSAAVAIAVALYSIDPTGPSGQYMPHCPVRWATGFDCPGCGAARAAHALLHLRFAEAAAYNYFLVISIPLLICAMVVEIAPAGSLRRCRKMIFSRPILYSYIALTLVWWIVRNILSI